MKAVGVKTDWLKKVFVHAGSSRFRRQHWMSLMQTAYCEFKGKLEKVKEEGNIDAN